MKMPQIVAWWAPRPLREKALIIAVTAAASMALGDALVTAPLEKRLKRARNDTLALDTKLRKIVDGQNAGAAESQSLREQEAQLRTRLQAAQAGALAVRQHFADTARLPETLRAIVTTVGSARLLELDLAGDPGIPAAAASAGNGATRLYRLPITLKVSGTYDELHLLLTQIERHAQALQWSSLTLDNAAWPAIQLTLKAHVLSHDPRWGSAT